MRRQPIVALIAVASLAVASLASTAHAEPPRITAEAPRPTVEPPKFMATVHQQKPLALEARIPAGAKENKLALKLPNAKVLPLEGNNTVVEARELNKRVAGMVAVADAHEHPGGREPSTFDLRVAAIALYDASQVGRVNGAGGVLRPTTDAAPPLKVATRLMERAAVAYDKLGAKLEAAGDASGAVNARHKASSIRQYDIPFSK